MPEDTEEQLNDKTRHSCSALQVDEATDSNTDCLFITFIRFIDLLF